jgi:hypothetical protein
VDVEADPALQTVHHGVDPAAPVGAPVPADEQLAVRHFRAVPGLVALDGCGQLWCDQHPARLLALGTAVPAHAELDPARAIKSVGTSDSRSGATGASPHSLEAPRPAPTGMRTGSSSWGVLGLQAARLMW